MSAPYSVYVASDDDSVGEELQALLNNKTGARYKVYFRFSPSSTHRVYTAGMGTAGSAVAGVYELLADFEALRTARVFIGTQSSNMGRTAFYARGRKNASLSLDGEWGDFEWT